MKPVRKTLTLASFSQERLATRVDTVSRALRNAIITGEISPGQVLFEGQLATRFNASKTPVREALNAAAYRGDEP